MPSSSWPPIGRSCSAEYQPGSGTDIELWVAGRTTSSRRRSHSAAWPLHAVTGACCAGASVPPLAAKTAAAPAISTAASTGTAMRRALRGRARAGAARSSAGTWTMRSTIASPWKSR